jgi:very-short-patch-repair endonuclease
MASRHVPPELCAAPFTRRQAIAAGLSDDQLQGSSWRQVFRGVWVAASVEDSRELRLSAARLILPDHGVLCGLTAAWVHGIDVRRLDDLDVHVGFAKGKRVRDRPGVKVCQETLHPDDIIEIDGVRVTSPTRTAFDCLRLLRGAERLVVADAATHEGLVTLEELRTYFAGQRRLRNLRIGARLLDLVEPKSESPMETRLRVVLLDGGLPRPQAQWKVYDRFGNHLGRLDLAYVSAKVGVEYDGADHWKQRREDDRRRAALRAVDWEVLVFSADDIFRTPQRTIAEVAATLRARAA